MIDEFVDSFKDRAELFIKGVVGFTFHALSVAAIGTKSPALGMPMFIVYLIMPVGLATTGIQYLLTLYRNLSENEPYTAYDQKEGYEA